MKEKRYHLRINNSMLEENTAYLNKSDDGELHLNTKFHGLGLQTIFTESEIQNMDVTSFIKIELFE